MGEIDLKQEVAITLNYDVKTQTDKRTDFWARRSVLLRRWRYKCSVSNSSWVILLPVRLGGKFYFKIVMLIKVKKVSESVVVTENEIAANTEKDCYE